MNRRDELLKKVIENLQRFQDVAPFDVNIWVAHWFEENADEEMLAKINADIEKEIDRYRSS